MCLMSGAVVAAKGSSSTSSERFNPFHFIHTLNNKYRINGRSKRDSPSIPLSCPRLLYSGNRLGRWFDYTVLRQLIERTYNRMILLFAFLRDLIFNGNTITVLFPSPSHSLIDSHQRAVYVISGRQAPRSMIIWRDFHTASLRWRTARMSARVLDVEKGCVTHGIWINVYVKSVPLFGISWFKIILVKRQPFVYDRPRIVCRWLYNYTSIYSVLDICRRFDSSASVQQWSGLKSMPCSCISCNLLHNIISSQFIVSLLAIVMIINS